MKDRGNSKYALTVDLDVMLTCYLHIILTRKPHHFSLKNDQIKVKRLIRNIHKWQHLTKLKKFMRERPAYCVRKKKCDSFANQRSVT